jgi:hypothetical protein
VSSSGPDAPAAPGAPPEPGDAHNGRSLRGIATDLIRPKPRASSASVDPSTAKRIVNGLDRRELIFASMTVAFDLYLILSYHSLLLHSSDKVSRGDAPDFLIAGLIASGLVVVGIAVRRRALLGFAVFLVGLDFLTYRLIVGFVYNAAMGGWLLFRVSQLQKRRALERGPSTRGARTRVRPTPSRGGRSSTIVTPPKPSKRYTPPKRRTKIPRP